MNRFLVAASLTLLPSLRAEAQAANAKSARVDSLMATQVAANGPGAAVLVIQDGKILHEKGYGLANITTKTPITSTTTFDLASCSKQFTAMAIMMLAERGKLSYDDPLTKFFPEFPAYASKITVRHLLNHTSGLPDYMGVFRTGPAGISAEPSSREALTMLTQIREPIFAPGEKWEYSNSGYVVLAQIVEKASDMSFPAFLKQNVFDPLGMSATIVSDQIKAPAVNRAISYAPAGGGFRDADYTPLNRIYGDGNVNTSLEDMFKWDQALYTDRLVKQSTLAAAFTPGTLNNGSRTNYGFGWTIAEENGVRMVLHGGAWVGFRTNITRIPSERFSVVVLSNAANFNPTLIARRIATIYLPDKLPPKVARTVDAKTLAGYVGTYQLAPGFTFDITLDGASLFAQVTGQPKRRLGAESDTRFFVIESEEIEMTFNKDSSGKVSGLTLHQNGDRPATRLPN